MDLLQLLILLTITGIIGAFAILIVGFSPRGVMILLFALIAGTIGAAMANGFHTVLDSWVQLPALLDIKIGTFRIYVLSSIGFSLLVVWLLSLLPRLVTFLDAPGAPRQIDQSSSAAAEPTRERTH